MRKIILCLILIALVPLVRAKFDINLERSYYSSGETLQAKINTNINFVDGISLSKINLTDSENKRVQVALNFFNLGNGSYYLFFDLPFDLKEGNYSLNFGNLLYYNEGVLKRELFKKEKDFKAHITLGRVKYVGNKEQFFSKLKSIKVMI